jgi:hypothetical protein
MLLIIWVGTHMQINTMKQGALLLSALIVSGCASTSESITASYVSPLQYQNYACPQLGEEAQRISTRVAQASGAQDQKRTNDALATTAAIIIFWPAAFLVGGGDNQNTAELARLKGEFEAVEKASIQKNCNLQFQKAPVPQQQASAN